MKDEKKVSENEKYSLNDDRRVKVLSPGAMVAKRFFRNRLAVVGLSALVFMFLFSFLGGLISPYGEAEKFTRTEGHLKEFGGVKEITDYKSLCNDGTELKGMLIGKIIPEIKKGSEEFTIKYKGSNYDVKIEGDDFYTVNENGSLYSLIFKDDISNGTVSDSFELRYEAVKAYIDGNESFKYDGEDYNISFTPFEAKKDDTDDKKTDSANAENDGELEGEDAEQLEEQLTETEKRGYHFFVSEGKTVNLGAQDEISKALDESADKEKIDVTYNGDEKPVEYKIAREGEFFYSIYANDEEVIGICYKGTFTVDKPDEKLPFNFVYTMLKAYHSPDKKENETVSFTYSGNDYTVEDGTVTADGKPVAFISNYVVKPKMSDTVLSQEFKDGILDVIKEAAENKKNNAKFMYRDSDGVETEYDIEYKPAHDIWQINQLKQTLVYDRYSRPSSEHLLGTDSNGMDVLTRLMYGGRVSLIIGFIVVFIENFIGIILGGIAGYFGGWVDNLIMRIVDIFYCIPSTPIIIILGGAMDAGRVDPTLRMLYLMLILGVLGWASIARMVRGQILSLREQEFMTATEACGVRVSRRIFRHLIPNVIPQLIVIATMGLGSTIITESTLSFLGLGVKFPFASWGNIISDVSNTYVLTHCWFVWIPAGVLLLVTVLAFNLVGDGLRDAFDPKMKR